MRVTEKQLLDNYKYITNCGDLCSIIDGTYYYWGYGAGYGSNYKRVLYRQEAESIRIEKRNGSIYSIELPAKCMNKKANDKIQLEIAKFYKRVCQEDYYETHSPTITNH